MLSPSSSQHHKTPCRSSVPYAHLRSIRSETTPHGLIALTMPSCRLPRISTPLPIGSPTRLLSPRIVSTCKCNTWSLTRSIILFLRPIPFLPYIAILASLRRLARHTCATNSRANSNSNPMLLPSSRFTIPSVSSLLILSTPSMQRCSISHKRSIPSCSLFLSNSSHATPSA